MESRVVVMSTLEKSADSLYNHKAENQRVLELGIQTFLSRSLGFTFIILQCLLAVQCLKSKYDPTNFSQKTPNPPKGEYSLNIDIHSKAARQSQIVSVGSGFDVFGYA